MLDINAMTTLLIALKTGTVINNTEADLVMDQKLILNDQYQSLTKIFRSPLFNNPNVEIHPNHDLETLESVVDALLYTVVKDDTRSGR